jgi:hypothetical protein
MRRTRKLQAAGDKSIECVQATLSAMALLQIQVFFTIDTGRQILELVFPDFVRFVPAERKSQLVY